MQCMLSISMVILTVPIPLLSMHSTCSCLINEVSFANAHRKGLYKLCFKEYKHGKWTYWITCGYLLNIIYFTYYINHRPKFLKLLILTTLLLYINSSMSISSVYIMMWCSVITPKSKLNIHKQTYTIHLLSLNEAGINVIYQSLSCN